LSQQKICVEYQTGNGHQSPKNTAFGQRIREDGLTLNPLPGWAPH
jgi:hypothetical protein